MSEAKKEETEGGEHGEAPKKGKKKLIAIIAVVLVLIVGGSIGFMALGGKPKDAEHEQEAEEEHPKHLDTAKLDTFVVNLAQSGSFLKTTILIEYDAELAEKAAAAHAGGAGAEGGGGEHGGGKGPALPAAIEHRLPMVKDAVIRVLSSKRGEDLLTTEGKETVKEDLIEALNEAVAAEEGPIVGIYFQEFLIQ